MAVTKVVRYNNRQGKQGEDNNNKGICPAALYRTSSGSLSPEDHATVLCSDETTSDMDYEPFKVSLHGRGQHLRRGETRYRCIRYGPRPHGQRHRVGRQGPDQSVGRTGEFSVCGVTLATAGGVGSTENFPARRLPQGRMTRPARNSLYTVQTPTHHRQTSRLTSRAASNTLPCCPRGGGGHGNRKREGWTEDKQRRGNNEEATIPYDVGWRGRICA